MGLNVGDSLYGISLYGNDVTPTMDLLGMNDFPVNTDGTAAGGLDMMAGGGYFIESGSLPVRIWNEGIQRQPNGIRLTWNAIHQTPARYQIIERATENGEYRAIASIDFQQNGRSFYQYIDRSTSNRASYRYRIRAVDGRGQQDSYSQETNSILSNKIGEALLTSAGVKDIKLENIEKINCVSHAKNSYICEYVIEYTIKVADGSLAEIFGANGKKRTISRSKFLKTSKSWIMADE
jgi:hypothetical protein